MTERLEFAIWTLNALDYLLAPLLFMVAHNRPQNIHIVNTAGYVFIFAYLFIASALLLGYSEEYFNYAKILATIGIILVALSISLAAEEVISAAYKGELLNTCIPPFYVPYTTFSQGVTSIVSRIGAILVILSAVMSVPFIIYDDPYYARYIGYMLSHISLPSIILLSISIVSHTGYLSRLSRNFVLLLKAAILLPIVSLILIDILLMMKTFVIRE